MTLHLKNFSGMGLGPEAYPKTVARRGGFYGVAGKRLFDIAFVILTAPFVLPLLTIVACVAMLDGGKPFYRQQRIGMGGRVFYLLKIRTMIADADRKLESYLVSDPAARQEWDTTQKLKHDPRITRFGRFLRKSSLDELPQLWNVLVGEMSVIGPRPMMVDQRSLYPGTAYYALRPGITGSWQVSDRNECTFAGRSDFDTSYYSGLSFRTDLSILLRTVAVVFRGTGY